MSATPSFAIGFCHNGTVRTEFMTSVLAASRHPQLIRIIQASGPYIHINRNNIVKDFLEAGDAEWLLFLDNDIQFKLGDIDELLAFANRDRRILAGLYFTWIMGVFMPCWFSSLTPPQAADPDVANIQLLASCGMGFTAIHKDVLTLLGALRPGDPSPWFGHDRITTLSGVYPAAEDVTFCQRAAQYGFGTFGIAPVAVDHIKTCVENRASYRMRKREAA